MHRGKSLTPIPSEKMNQAKSKHRYKAICRFCMKLLSVFVCLFFSCDCSRCTTSYFQHSIPEVVSVLD